MTSIANHKVPGFLHHILLLWRLRMVMAKNGAGSLWQLSSIISSLLVAALGLFLAGFCFWFMSHPAISNEWSVSQFYLNLLCFVTAMLWILWPVLSAGVEDGSERERYIQYPISETRLLLATVISSVFKPVGVVMFAPLVGASLGYLSGHGSQGYGQAMLLLVAFVAMCATWSQAGVYFLRDILRAKSNGKALSITLLVFMAVGVLLPQVDISWLYKQAGGVGVSDESELEKFTRIADAFAKVPPGYLGEGLMAIAENRPVGALLEGSAMLLLAWFGLWHARYRLKRSSEKSQSYQSLQQYRRDLFTLGGKVDLTLAQRELFELWRNPRFRLLSIVPFFLIVVLHLVSANELLQHFFGEISQLYLMAGAGIYAATLILLTFTHNTFAYDGRGLLNLMNAPITHEQILKSKGRVHQLVSVCLGVAAMLFYWLYVAGKPNIEWVYLSLMGLLIVIPIVAVVGLWVSVFYPIKFDASLNRRERQPFLVSIAGFFSVAVGVIPFVMAARFYQAGMNVEPLLVALLVIACLVWLLQVWVVRWVGLAFAKRQAEILSAITRV